MSQLSVYEAYVTEAEHGRAKRIKTADGEEYDVSDCNGAIPYLTKGHPVDVVIKQETARILSAMVSQSDAFLLPVSYENDGTATVDIPEQIQQFRLGFSDGGIDMSEGVITIKGGTISLG